MPDALVLAHADLRKAKSVPTADASWTLLLDIPRSACVASARVRHRERGRLARTPLAIRTLSSPINQRRDVHDLVRVGGGDLDAPIGKSLNRRSEETSP
jgi:hypothetical protein